MWGNEINIIASWFVGHFLGYFPLASLNILCLSVRNDQKGTGNFRSYIVPDSRCTKWGSLLLVSNLGTRPATSLSFLTSYWLDATEGTNYTEATNPWGPTVLLLPSSIMILMIDPVDLLAAMCDYYVSFTVSQASAYSDHPLIGRAGSDLNRPDVLRSQSTISEIQHRVSTHVAWWSDIRTVLVKMFLSAETSKLVRGISVLPWRWFRLFLKSWVW